MALVAAVMSPPQIGSLPSEGCLLATTYLRERAFLQLNAILTGTKHNDTPVCNFSG